MDDLTFRRTVYADPNTQDPDLIKAAKQDPKKQAFWDEVKQFDADVLDALSVPVPENLSQKLILRQSIKEDEKQKQRRPWYLSMAASIVLIALISVALLQPTPSSIASDALAHVTHVELEAANYGSVDMQVVNDKLSTYNGSISQAFDNVVSANYCYLNKIKSLHIIVQGKSGLLSLFVLPDEETSKVDDRFSDKKHSGLSFLIESTRVLVVGENEEEVISISEKAQQNLKFSA